MKTLTLENDQINTIKNSLIVSKHNTSSDQLKGLYMSIILNIEQQNAEIDESDPQKVWDELKKEVTNVTEVWKEKICELVNKIDDYHAQSKVSYLIDKIEHFVTYMNEIENNL